MNEQVFPARLRQVLSIALILILFLALVALRYPHCVRIEDRYVEIDRSVVTDKDCVEVYLFGADASNATPIAILSEGRVIGYRSNTPGISMADLDPDRFFVFDRPDGTFAVRAMVSEDRQYEVNKWCRGHVGDEIAFFIRNDFVGAAELSAAIRETFVFGQYSSRRDVESAIAIIKENCTRNP